MWRGGEETPIFFLSRMVVENGCYSLLNRDGAHQISSSRPMHPEGGSLLDSLVGVHACVLDASFQFFFYNDLHYHISSIFISVVLSYLE